MTIAFKEGRAAARMHADSVLNVEFYIVERRYGCNVVVTFLVAMALLEEATVRHRYIQYSQ